MNIFLRPINHFKRAFLWSVSSVDLRPNSHFLGRSPHQSFPECCHWYIQPSHLISHSTWACVSLSKDSVCFMCAYPVRVAKYLNLSPCIYLSIRLSIVMGVCLRALSRFILVFFLPAWERPSSLFAARIKWLAQLYFPMPNSSVSLAVA